MKYTATIFGKSISEKDRSVEFFSEALHQEDLIKEARKAIKNSKLENVKGYFVNITFDTPTRLFVPAGNFTI